MRIAASLILIAAIAIVAWFFKDSVRTRQAPGTTISSRSLPARAPQKITPQPAVPVNPGSNPPTTPSADSTTSRAAVMTPTAVAEDSAPAVVERQAKIYVAKLTAPDPMPIRVEQADNFVTGDQLFSLIPQSAVKKTTVAKLLDDKSLAPDAPITVVKKVEQIQRVSPEKLIAGSAGNLDTPIKQLVDDQVITTTVRKVLAAVSRNPDQAIDIVTEVEYFEQTTKAELAAEIKNDDSLKADSVINVITKPHGLEAASMGDLLRTRKPDTIAAGIPTAVPIQIPVREDDLFYVRTVRPEDTQGIWGIVQEGIIKNFARGMAIRRGREVNTYQVVIPNNSDEKISADSSSFLGRLIFRKTNESYVFNYRQNRMGRNPDRIYPGQEIVIINFKPEELIGIYKHFVAQRG